MILSSDEIRLSLFYVHVTNSICNSCTSHRARNLCNNYAVCNSCQYKRSDGSVLLQLSNGYTDFISATVAAVTWGTEFSYLIYRPKEKLNSGITFKLLESTRMQFGYKWNPETSCRLYSLQFSNITSVTFQSLNYPLTFIIRSSHAKL
jgi:hypothetical protein